VAAFFGVDRVDGGVWDDLATLAGPGGTPLLVSPERYDIPPGWTDVLTLEGAQMVADRLVAPPADAAIRPLTTADVPAMLALVALARPGPFAPATIKLGRYVGVFDTDALVAMAGERMRLPGWTEVSAVATHPDARRRGLGALLTHHVARRIADEGATPFLHVAAGNDGARRVYERLGFTTRRVLTFRVLRSPSPSV